MLEDNFATKLAVLFTVYLFAIAQRQELGTNVRVYTDSYATVILAKNVPPFLSSQTLGRHHFSAQKT